jgi:protein O-mannosyl-transferase
MATPAIKSEANLLVEVRPKDGLFRSPGKRTAILSLLLVLLTLITYNTTAHNGFVNFDDPAYITANPHVKAGITWDTLKWAFKSTEDANWHPLTWLSHALDYQIFHLKPAGHHYVNVLLHAATAVLLFLFFQAATGFVWRGAMVAALFAIHPINVQSVAWASERKNVLCMLFFALMLLAYRRYTEQRDWKRYALLALLFAMGLMSKPMLVTVPFVLLLLDYWPLQRTRETSWGRLVLEKLPLLAMSVASSMVTMVAQAGGGAIHSEFPLSNRLLNAIASYACYVGKAIWPSHLASFYPHPEHIPTSQWALGIVTLVAITTAVAWCRDYPYLAVGWLWFLGTLVPMIGLVPVGEQAMADRYAYLPFIGLFVAAIWGIADCVRAKQVPATYLAVISCCVLGGLAVVTHIQIGYWKDTKTLWTHALAVAGPNFVAEDSLGAELIDEGKLQEAVSHFQNAAAINPRDAFSRLNLGVCQKRMGNINAAAENYGAALQLSSDRNLKATAFGNLGSIYRLRGDYPRARANFESALGLLPDYSLALTGMGLVAQKTSDPGTAANYFARAAKTAPSDTEFLLLSQALAKAGHQPEAQAALAQAQNMSQNWSATVQMVNHLLQE